MSSGNGKNPSGVDAAVYDDRYYDTAAGQAEAVFSHPGLAEIQRLAAACDRVLDCGCGEGAKLDRMGHAGTRRIGVEWSPAGVRRAARREGVTVVRGDIRRLPFPDGAFPLVYSAYVLEHLDEPGAVIREMIRVTAAGGHAAFLCPNFGSPFFRSPCGRRGPWRRGLRLMVRDALIRFTSTAALDWERVTPLAAAGNWASDWDTTVEPALIPLLHHLRGYPAVRVVSARSFWAHTPATDGRRAEAAVKRIVAGSPLRFLPLVRYWGPDLFVVVRKTGPGSATAPGRS